jgi:site-specific recombinase XerD
VKLKEKIYNYERTLNRLLEKIRSSSLDRKSKTQLLEFYHECLAQGLSFARIIKYLDTLERIGRALGKPFEKAAKSDILEFVRKIEQKDWSEWTKHDYKTILKIFFRWLRKSEEYPEEVRWIKTRPKNNNVLPEELLTEDEVKKMAERTLTLRDKAFILVLYETGCRIGEILSLKLRNVEQDCYGAVLIVNGKTGSRRIRIIASAPALSSWISNHPLRENPDAPLWITLGTNSRYSLLTYRTACDLLKKAAEKAGIKKRVYPHLFRHSRATHLANHLTEAQMKQYFGWVQSSKMAATYVHLSGRDIDNAILKMYGFQIEEKREENFKLIRCPRCKQNNSPGTKFCNYCSLVLDPQTAMKLEETQRKADELLNALVKNPEVVKVLLKAINKLSFEER